jgi:phage terminase large subunit-like protein
MTKKKQTRSPRTSADPVTKFAEEVVSGKRIAGKIVRDQCARHLRDIETGLFVWDLALANKAIGFFHDVLKLNGGDFEGVAFELLPWQKFVVGSLFGWVGADGHRRFRVAYVETAKGSGKSPLAAGIGMKGLVADGEPRAEVYSAATKKDQATILFRDAVAMVDQSPELSKRLQKSGTGERCWNLAYLSAGAFFRPISSDDGQSGPRPHIALIDEIHEHKTNNVVEMMRAGTKSRRQALIFMITNSGSSRYGPCWGYHEYGAQVASGERTDDAFFPFICGLDEGDDPFEDESCWPKANPSLQDANLPGYKYIREQVVEAKGMPSKEAIVRRLNFCQWTDAESPWLSHELWTAARREYSIEDLRGRRALAGLDLSSTTDLTGLVFLVEPVDADEPWKLVPFAWLPDVDLERKAKTDKVPYVEWVAQGLLDTTPGRAISKRVILQKVSAMCDFFEITAVAYDRWRMEDLLAMAEDDGISLPEIKPFGQGYKDMSPAIETFEKMLLNGELVHNGHKVLTMCAGNAVTDSDGAGNRKLDKAAATGRIDLIVCAVMAAGMVNTATDGSCVYNDVEIYVG